MGNTIKKKLQKDFEGSSDFICQDLKIGSVQVELFYIDNMIEKVLVSENIIEPIIKLNQDEIDLQKVLQKVEVVGTKIVYDYNEITNNILNGFVVISLNQFNGGVICSPCQGFKSRPVAEPPTAAILKGPREGFTEDVGTNISLIRRRIKSTDIKFEEIKIGRYTDTKVYVSYISGVADLKVVNEIKEKLNNINIDGIIDSFYIESLISPKKNNIFKQIGNTEKPDVAASKLLEGRVAILVDGSPMVLTIPYIFLEDLQSGGDYYDQAAHASLIRVLRLLGIIVSIMLPGVYVALQSFHYGILPIDFLISIQTSIEGLSYPPLIEILVVLFLFEILNEASIRMPKYSGMALSIVGALVLGDTAVKAGLISPPAVIMVAISGITMFTVPSQIYIASILRFVFTIIGGVTGFYGLLTAFMFLISYLLSLDAFGAPYFAPYAPNVKEDKKDGIIKKKLFEFTTRPQSIPNINKVRQRNDESSN